MSDPALVRFMVMPLVGLAIGIRDGQLDAKARTKPLEYKVWSFLKATALPFLSMTIINAMAQAASPQQGVNLLEAIGFAGLGVGLLYTLARNITNTIVSTRRAAAAAKPGGYGLARFILSLYCVAGIAAIWLVARGSSTVSTQFGHVQGDQYQIASQVPGRVAEVLIADNQLVEVGQPLVRIDDARFRAIVRTLEGMVAAANAARDATVAKLAIVRVTTGENIKAARADLAAAKNRLEQARLGVAIAQAQAEQGKANIAVASATLDLLDFQKRQIASAFETDRGTVPLVRKKSSETFYESGTAAVSATKSVHQAALRGVEIARQLLVVAEQGVEARQADLAKALTGPEEVKQAEAEVAAAGYRVEATQAKLEQARLNLSRCLITAPARGHVTQKSVEVGNWLKRQQPLLAISAGQPYVMAKFREPDLYRIKPGQKVDLLVAAYPDSPLTGTVDSIDPGTAGAESLFPPSNATGQFVKYIQRSPVKITIPTEQLEAGRPLVLGMNVTVTITDPEPNQRMFN